MDLISYLEEWAHLDRDHSNSLLGATEALKASTLRLPVVEKAVVCATCFSFKIKMYSECEDSIDRPNGPKPEIDKMGFGGLKYIPKWSVDQKSYFYLAENFNLIRNYIRTDVDDITVNAAIIGRALGLPSHGIFRPTSTAKISPNKHLPTILNVENAMAYNWSFHILDWVKDAIADFQHNGVKHISGCMYALLILYCQRIRHGPLEQCTIEPPWVRD
ncbi:hypothetical protein PIB30_069216 [Stylosanthes scabra]|uniref:Uncharacterized protein n=1 Tax=Stylosanthes scabra TaxID=79078 RepID=A0ABU6VP28_9FABA|nr:hypothetical protein [Stylosanthes scabra]